MRRPNGLVPQGPCEAGGAGPAVSTTHRHVPTQTGPQGAGVHTCVCAQVGVRGPVYKQVSKLLHSARGSQAAFLRKGPSGPSTWLILALFQSAQEVSFPPSSLQGLCPLAQAWGSFAP